MKKFLLIILPLFVVMFTSCEPKEEEENKNGTILFNSGFEGDSRWVVTEGTSQNERVTGTDNSVLPPNNWDKFCTTNANNRYPRLGQFSVYYEGGDVTSRKARLVADPLNPDNTALYFAIYSPNVIDVETEMPQKCRIEAQVGTARPPIYNLYQKVKVMFPSRSMDVLKHYPASYTWFTVAELWNDRPTNKQDDKYVFRVSVNMGHDEGADNPFFFTVSADTFVPLLDENYQVTDYESTRIKQFYNRDFIIPFDKWMTLEYYIRDGNETANGDKKAGHFYMAITPEGGEKVVLFNERMATHHPADNESDGLTNWQPMKMYTYKEIGYFMQERSQPLEIFWDDFILFTDKIPEDQQLANKLMAN